MNNKELWEYICTFLPIADIYALAQVSQLHGEICSPSSPLWLKLLTLQDMVSPLYHSPNTNWKVLYKLAFKMFNWDPTCLAYKATRCMVKEYMIPMLYNAKMKDNAPPLRHISCVCLVGLVGGGRTFFLSKILPLTFRGKVDIIMLSENPFPTIEKLEEDVDRAIQDQKPVVIIIDDLTAMNGVYAHPYVYNTDYQGKFVKVLQKVRETKNQILIMVSINMDKTALQLFAGAIQWDWVLYFGIPSLGMCKFLLNRQFQNKAFPSQKDMPELLERMKANTISEIICLFTHLLKEMVRAELDNTQPTVTQVFTITNYMKKPQNYDEFASFIQTLSIQSQYGVLSVNSSDHDAQVVKALIPKRKVMEEDVIMTECKKSKML